MNNNNPHICTIGERISSLVEHLSNGNISAFAQSLNINEANIRSYMNRGVMPKADILEKIVTYYDVDANWLMTGVGNMQVSRSANIDSGSSNSGGVPLLPIEAMAGFFTGEVSVAEGDCERINVPGLKADFVVPVRGDSMEPKYFSGDLVACQAVYLSDLFFQWGKVYVIDTDQGVLLKKVKKGSKPNSIKLISENPEYDTIEVSLSAIHHIALVKCLVRMI